MLSVLAARIAIRYMFGLNDRRIETIHRWEWLFAAGAFFTSLGWGALFGPLYPPATHPDSQMLVALTSVRPYKAAWSIEAAQKYLAEESGKHFDPALIKCFMLIMPGILEIRARFAD